MIKAIFSKNYSSCNTDRGFYQEKEVGQCERGTM